MTPTQKAKDLARPVEQALSLLASTLAVSREFNPKECTRTFRLAMSDWVAIVLLPYLTNILRKATPLASLIVYHFQVTEMQKALDEDDIDIAITGLPRFGESAFKQKLFFERYQTIVSSKHPKIRGKLSLENYIRYPHVLYSPEGRGPGAVDTALAKKGLKRQIAIRVPLSAVIPPMISGSDMISTLPEKVCRLFAKMIDIHIFDPPIELKGHDIVQYWHKKYHQDPAHKWFRNTLVHLCKNLY